ncbi:MAG: hypothetical protein H6Q67_1172 [Firmicutes bacterium]|nr:hypothetical protein [Bacillota bacterium]
MEPSDKNIITFANKYGLLLPDESIMIPPNSKVDNDTYSPGETIEFWMKQIRLMKTALTYWQYYRREDIQSLKNVISKQNDTIKYSFESSYFSLWKKFHKQDIQDRDDTLNFDKLKEDDLFLLAKFFVQQEINDQCKEYPVEPCLLFDKEDNSLKQYYRPSSLISLLWFQFFRYVSGEQKIKECPICRKWYDVSGNVSSTGIKSIVWNKHCTDCGNRLYAKKSIVKKQYTNGMSIDEIIRHSRKVNPDTIKKWIQEWAADKNIKQD